MNNFQIAVSKEKWDALEKYTGDGYALSFLLKLIRKEKEEITYIAIDLNTAHDIECLTKFTGETQQELIDRLIASHTA